MAFVLVNGKEYKSKNIEITGGRLTIGRSLDNDIILRDDQVSSRHAQLVLNDRAYWLQDLGSTNGTLIAGNRIIQQRLNSGDEFTIAAYKLTFSDTDTYFKEKELASVEDVRRVLHEQLIEELNLKKLSLDQMADKALRQNASDVLDRLIQAKRKDIPRDFDVKSIKKAVLDAALGLGPLEDMLADETITEIMVNGPNKIFVEQKGRLKLSDKSFLSKREILTAIERIVGPIGRRIDESSPMVDARLADGSRVNAIIPPLALDSPVITIRKFPTRRFGMDDYIKYGSLTKPMIDFLRVCVLAAKNTIISGGTGTGKTTLLNVLSSYIPDGERVLTIEDSAELRLTQTHVVRMETRPANIEGKGEVTIRDLVRNALRMRPNRVVVGECRGGEALDMLQAMNTGHDGSLTTVHANTPPDACRRLENLVLMAGMDLPLRAIRELIASAVHIIVQISRFTDGTRKITAITEVTGIYDGDIQLQDIFTFRRTGISPDGRVQGVFSATGVIPVFLEELLQAGMDVDMSMFVPVEMESGEMIFAALLMTFFAVILAFYLIYVPIRASIMKTSSEAADRVARELEDIFIFIPVNYVYMLKFGLMAALGLLGFLLTFTSKPPFPFIMAGVGGLLGYFGPELILMFLRHRRRKKFSEQLVDCLTMMANGLRAGFTLQQAVEMVVEEMPAPVSQEFDLIMREYRVGVDLDEALWRCVRRTKDPDLELAVSAIAITRKLGGNIAEIFDRIVDMVRDRKLLAGKADALTAQGRLQALVVGLLPYALGFFIFQINPEMMSIMWTTWTGLGCLVLIVVLDVVGYTWVKKIANIKY